MAKRIRPPIEFAKNAAMAIPAVSRAVRARHTHATSQAGYAESIVRDFAALSPIPLTGLRILELGPGSALGLARAASAYDIGSYSAFDTHPYANPAEVVELEIDYQANPAGIMPWRPGSFDLIWSHSVLEHVAEPAGVLRQCRELLADGGVFIGLIDLGNHLEDRRRAESIYSFLKYPEWVWRLMTSHRSTYVNRLRYSEWRDLLASAGFEIQAETRLQPDIDIDEFRKLPYLASVSEDDLMTRECVICAVVS